MRFRLRALVMAGVVTAGSITASTATTLPAHADTQICDAFGSTTIQGRYIVQNNRWGSSNPQCITVTGTGFRVTTSEANKPTNGGPASYPSVYYGCHYNNCSPGTILPLAATDARFAGVRTSVNMSYPSGGQWDAAYDVWFDPTARKDGQNTGAEIMVWLNHAGPPQPVGSKVATASIAGASWDVWFGNIGWNVISYVRTAGTGSADFAPAAFFTDSVGRGYAQRSWYLTSIQAGFEPWLGGAGLAVNSFAVTTGNAPGATVPGNKPPTTAAGKPSTSSGSSPSASGQPPAGGGSGTCRVTYAANAWPTGFIADVHVSNTGGTPVEGWTVTWTWAGNQRVVGAWNAAITSSGTSVTARNETYNGTLAAGATTSFGFQGAYSGTNAPPRDFAVNGSPCSAA